MGQIPDCTKESVQREGAQAKSDSASSSSSSSSSNSSSDSGSGSSSDSSDSGGSGDKQAKRRVALEGLVRAPGNAELVVDLGDLGQIRYNQTFGFLRAHCPLHGATCLRQRTLADSPMPSRAGQGRPVGLLVHWLQKASDYGDAASHKKMAVGSFSSRSQAREHVKAYDSHDALFQVEREQRESEDEGEEPTTIP